MVGNQLRLRFDRVRGGAPERPYHQLEVGGHKGATE